MIAPPPSIPPVRDYRCARCNYGAVLKHLHVPCPMCGSPRWQASLRRAPGLVDDLAQLARRNEQRPEQPAALR